ncbi:RNA polymerase sigma factor [Citromicrobium bathyomarinum]
MAMTPPATPANSSETDFANDISNPPVLFAGTRFGPASNTGTSERHRSVTPIPKKCHRREIFKPGAKRCYGFAAFDCRGIRDRKGNGVGRAMVDDTQLQIWFCEEVLPLEPSLTRYLRKNWRTEEDVTDLRQDVYEAALNGARRGLPDRTQGYLFTIARNILINRAKRDRIVSFEQVADLESAANAHIDIEGSERHLAARDALRRAQAGMEGLPPRCREVVRLRKVEGMSRLEAAEAMGVGLDTIDRQLRLGIRAMADAMLGGSGRIQREEPQRARRSKLQ